MSHGSPLALELTVSLEMRITGVPTTRIDLPNLMTTPANTSSLTLPRLDTTI